MSVRLLERVGRTIMEMRAEELRLKRAARNADAGKNIPNGVADCSIAFPWEDDLRANSPINTIHSHLRAYWYRAGERWVLYDVMPVELIDDGQDCGSGLSGADLKAIMAGPPPSQRPDYGDVEHWPVSDVQHEMWRLWHGFARPFWVLQGESGGHQVKFSPDQSQALLRMGLQAEAPRIGSLPPCPFDNRVIRQLQHLNRLHEFEDSVGALRRSGSADFARAQHERVERQIRDSEMAFIEAQMRPVVDMAGTLNQRSEHADQLVHVPSGMASKAADAYEQYQETGRWSL